MLRHFALWGLLWVFAVLFGACEKEGLRDENGDFIADPAELGERDPDSLMRTNYYYISNPVATSGGCANALRLTAKGSGITSITPLSGCWIDQVGPSPSWDSLTSPGAATLSDTWYLRGTAFDKDNTSATGQAWCDPANTVTVKVVGSTITSLTYWFTDDWDCFW